MPAGQVVVEFTREDFGNTRAQLQTEGRDVLIGPSTSKARILTQGVPNAALWRRPNTGISQNNSGFLSWGEQPCSISVVDSAGKPVKMLKQGVGGDDAVLRGFKKKGYKQSDALDTQASPVFTDFILTQAQISSAEKSQIIETFGESYFYFFGTHTQILRCEATLINTVDYPWVYEWVWNYDNLLRGTKLMEMKARAYLAIGLDVYEGYFANYDFVRTSTDEYKVPMSFTFYVTNVIHVADSMWGDWHKSLILPETFTEQDRIKKEAADKAVGKAMLRTVIGNTWGMLTNPSAMQSKAAWANFGVKTAIGLGGNLLDGLAGATSGGGLFDFGTLLGFTAGVAQTAIGNANNPRALAGIGTGFASDIMEGLVTDSSKNSALDSNGNAMVAAIGVKGQAVGAAKNGYIPGPGSW